MYYTITFNNTHHAIALKKILSKYISIRTMPVLREISASCGIALRIEYSDFAKLNNILENNKNIFDFDLYLVENNKPIKIEI